MRAHLSLLFFASATLVSSSLPAQIVRSGTGIGATVARDQFRADLGGGAVAGPNGSFGGQRREINWDGVPDRFAAPNTLPANFFNVNSPRGAVFSTPGTGFQVSANAGTGPTDFANIDPSYSGFFNAFSPQRLFTAIGSNIMDVRFFVPGTATPALVRGFGAIFSDVDRPSTTSITFFDASDALLASFSAPNVAGNETFSFIGASFADPLVARVRIIAGNVPLATGTLDNDLNDLVVMDDFLYGEPVRVPEPASWALMIGGFGLLGWRVRARRRAFA